MLNWYQNRKYQHLEPQFSYNDDGDELKKFIKPSKTIYNSFMEYEIDTFHDYYYEKYKNERIKFMNQLVKKKYNNIRLRSILNINPLIDDNILLNVPKNLIGQYSWKLYNTLGVKIEEGNIMAANGNIYQINLPTDPFCRPENL